MKAQLPHPEHYSYQQHRKQRNIQIILPVVISILLLIGVVVLISLATFNASGEVERWAAISTIWIVIPIMVVGILILIVLGGLIYLMIRVLHIIPPYTAIAQDYVYRAQGYIIRAADMVAKPIIALNGYLENISAFFRRIKRS